jgi:hypothetical protein
VNTKQSSGLRTGNKALDYLLSQYPQDAKLLAVLDLLAKLGADLYHDAREAARTLLRTQTPNRLTRLAGGIASALSGPSAKETTLTNCIFDLQLTVFFSETKKYFGDNAIASVLVDALLYQATGFEANSPTETQLLVAGTHNIRGIHKFQVARKSNKSKPHIGDTDAWSFGKEFSAILTGNPDDIAYIVSCFSFSLIARVQARWDVRYLLYGTLPTKEEQQGLKVSLKKQEEELQKIVDEFSRAKKAQNL